jgi:hypothetical protein
MNRPRTKSAMTLVKLGARYDAAVLALARENATSYADCIRMLVGVGFRQLIRSGTKGGWILPESLERILSNEESAR